MNPKRISEWGNGACSKEPQLGCVSGSEWPPQHDSQNTQPTSDLFKWERVTLESTMLIICFFLVLHKYHRIDSTVQHSTIQNRTVLVQYNPASKMSPMALDPMSLCLFVLNFLKFGGNLKAARGEIHAYMNMLAMAISIFHDVEATRQATWCPRALGEKIDRQLQEISRTLDDAGRDVHRMMHDVNDPQLHLLGTSGTLAWTLTYNHVARANKDGLQLCINQLYRIERKLDQASAACPQAVEHFKATRREMWNVQSMRAARTATLYEGKGERSVKMLA